MQQFLQIRKSSRSCPMSQGKRRSWNGLTLTAFFLPPEAQAFRLN